jgi:hypothetical protein
MNKENTYLGNNYTPWKWQRKETHHFFSRVLIPYYVSFHYVTKNIMWKIIFLISFKLISTGVHIFQLMLSFKKCVLNCLLSSFLITQENHNIIMLSSQLLMVLVFGFHFLTNMTLFCWYSSHLTWLQMFSVPFQKSQYVFKNYNDDSKTALNI